MPCRALDGITFSLKELQKYILFEGNWYKLNILCAKFMFISAKLTKLQHHFSYISACTAEQLVPKGMFIQLPLTLGSNNNNLARLSRILDYKRSIHQTRLLQDWLPHEIKDTRSRFFKLRNTLRWNMSCQTYQKLWSRAKTLHKKLSGELESRRTKKLERDNLINQKFCDEHNIRLEAESVETGDITTSTQQSTVRKRVQRGNVPPTPPEPISQQPTQSTQYEDTIDTLSQDGHISNQIQQADSDSDDGSLWLTAPNTQQTTPQPMPRYDLSPREVVRALTSPLTLQHRSHEEEASQTQSDIYHTPMSSPPPAAEGVNHDQTPQDPPQVRRTRRSKKKTTPVMCTMSLLCPNKFKYQMG